MAAAPTTEELRAAIKRFLEAHNTATLATAGEAGPWAATVFYASDADLNLYFVSDHRTRHGRDLAASPRLAAAVNPDCGRWSEVRGLQMEGQVRVLDGAARVAGLARYLARFPDVAALFERPRDRNEETIASRLKAANLYRLRPAMIRLIDNSRWFGFKAELRLD